MNEISLVYHLSHIQKHLNSHEISFNTLILLYFNLAYSKFANILKFR